MNRERRQWKWGGTIVARDRRDRGFTLVELLIVVVILGVLAGVAVMAVRGVTNRGERGSCTADYRMLAIAVEAYRGEYGAYPASEADLVGSYLRSESRLYDIDPATGEVVAEVDAAENTIGCLAPPESMA